MKKEHRSALIEFTSNVSDEELKYIGVRLVERLTGDVAEVLQYMERQPLAHSVILEAKDGQEVFAMLGVVQEAALKEAKRRGMVLSVRPLSPVE